MVIGTADQGKGARVKKARVTPLLHFCVSGVNNLFQYHVEKFFHYYFKGSTICDEFIRHWNIGVCLSNQVNRNTRVRPKRPQVPRLGLKRGQFYWAVNSLCAKFRGILQDINVASKLFYSYCCSFYVCQLWDLSSNYIEVIYVAWQKAVRRIFNLPYNTHRYLLPFVVGSPHIRVNLENRFNNFVDALMSSDNKIIELLV